MQTLILILLPMLVAPLLLLVNKGKTAQGIALGASVLNLAFFVMTLESFDPAGGVQFVTDVAWINELGIHFMVGMDGISYALVFLTVLLSPIIIASTFNKDFNNPGILYALILMMEGALVGVFTARDAVVFYFFWEAALIPVYFIAGVWSGSGRWAIFFKFFIYTIAGSLIMLLAFAYLYTKTEPASTNIDAIYAAGRSLSGAEQSIIYLALFIAFAIKMPIFPFHTWQPDTYTESTTPATMLLSGIMLKMGIYGVIRWLLPVVPDAAIEMQNTVIVLSIIGVVYGSVIALQQRDIKRLLAFSSFAHVGLMAAGVFVNKEAGMQGAMIQMLAHGINVVGLFYIVDIIERRTGSRELATLGGITQSSPAFTIYFTILMLGSVALPLTNGFIGEFLLLKSIYDYNIGYAAVAGTTIILGAVYMLRMYQGVMFGKKTELTENFSGLTFGENCVLLSLCVVVIWMGLHPAGFMDFFRPSVVAILQSLS